MNTEKNKTLFREIKEDIHKWRVILGSWTGKLNNIIKMAIFPKLIYSYNKTLTKASFFGRRDKLILWKNKGSRIAKTLWKKKNKVKRLTVPDFETYYYTAISRQCDIGVKTDTEFNGPATEPHFHDQLIFFFYKGAKTIQWERTVFSINGMGGKYLHEKKMNLVPHLTPCTIINYKPK